VGIAGTERSLTDQHDFARRWREARGLDATREVLRDAAYEIICTDGLDHLNMRGLAARIGVSAMAAYRYYPNKETLIEGIRLQVIDRFADSLQVAGRLPSDPVGRLRNMCIAYLDFAVRNEQDYRLMFGTVAFSRLGAEDTRHRASAWEALLQVLADLPSSDRAAPIVDQAHLVWGNLHGIAMLHLSRRLILGRSVQEFAEPLIGFLLKALCVPVAEPEPSRHPAR
jgi:AcrR family transcriptional regulator